MWAEIRPVPAVSPRVTVVIAAISSGARATTVIMGFLCGCYFLLWSIDVRGWTSRVLIFFYRKWGSTLWPWGTARGYIVFNRSVGAICFGLCVVVVVAGIVER